MSPFSKSRMQILDMIAEGKISAEEGARMLEALPQVTEEAVKAAPSPGIFSSKMAVIRVFDRASGELSVNLRLPLSLVSTARRLGAKVISDGRQIDLEGILTALQAEDGEGSYRLELEDEIIEIVIE